MKNKPLWQSGNLAIVIFDEKNYAVCRDGKPKSYHNKIEGAVLAVCRSYANESCTNLFDWLEKFNTAMTWFAEQMTGGARNALAATEAIQMTSDPSAAPPSTSGSESETQPQEK